MPRLTLSHYRDRTWVAVIVLGIGLLIAAGLGLFGYIAFTSTPLHPNAQAVPSLARSVVAPKWNSAVDQARQIVRESVSEQNLPGLSVAVGVGGEIVWAEGFGWADLEKRVPVAPDTRFRIGTASTVLTSAAVGLLLEKGRLKLDDEIQTYVPEFPKKPWPVTLRQVMAHVAGVGTTAATKGRCSRSTASGRSTRCSTSRTVRCSSSRGPVPLFELRLDSGERRGRSRRGRAVPRFMREQVFEPLGMDDTRADSATEPPRIGRRPTSRASRRSRATARTRCVSSTTPATRDPASSCPPRPIWCASRWRSTAARCCSPRRSQLLQTPQRLRVGRGDRVGLGWDLENVEAGGRTDAHGRPRRRFAGGMVASLMTFPGRGIVVSVMSNTSYADTSGVGSKIAQAFADQDKRAARR